MGWRSVRSVWVLATGATVLGCGVLAAAVANGLVSGGTDAVRAKALGLETGKTTAAQVLSLPVRHALSADLWNGWARERISGSGYLTLPRELPPPPDMLATSSLAFSDGGLGRMGDDFSWLGDLGRGLQLNAPGGSFVFRSRGNGRDPGGRSHWGGWSGGGWVGGGGGAGGGGGGAPFQAAFVPDPSADTPAPDTPGQPGRDIADERGNGEDNGNGNGPPDGAPPEETPPEETPVVYDPEPDPEINPPDPPPVEAGRPDQPGDADPTVPVNNPNVPGQQLDVAQVPEPGALPLLGVSLGLLGLGMAARRRRTG